MTSKLPETTQPSTIRTFLIADIRGWTRFTRELGDEAASRLAAKFAQIVGEGVEAWGGRLLELRGDEAMCTFESARRALRCAVELQEAFIDESTLAPELPLHVGIGLDAGEAVPVRDGYRGTALNVAARLCSTAAAGEVIATGSLAHLAGRMEGLAFADLDAKPMKGFDVPVSAVLVDSAAPHEHDYGSAAASRPAPPPLPAELDAIVPLVGRDADLRWLAWHWRRARHGHGGVVAISGVQGIGRTRLAAELASIAHQDGAVVAYGPGGDGELVVVDDVDHVPAQAADALDRLLGDGGNRRLVVLTAGDSLPQGRAPTVERQRRLGPIDVAAVTEIGRLYLDDPGVDVPAHLLHEESHGIPAAVHRVASQWAGAAARRRLGDSARRTSRERRDLRAAEAAMIDDVERLELTRERARLYVQEVEPEAGDQLSPASSLCPYKGLATFEATDAEYYFGRERLVAELVARMVGSAFIGLIGASGSGKSSALQAGLLPALAGGVIPGSEEWIQAQVRPGEQPMRELRRALHRALPHQPPEDAPPADSLETALGDLAPAQRLLLVVDQFEELFTSATDEGERAEFIDLLTEQRPRMKVLVAVRADHYERCAAYPRVARLLAADQVLVGPLTAAEIAGIIRHPAERVGLRVEPELVEALVSDIGTEPGGLPLLSTALLELWEARDGDRLTLAAYRATGGVRGAVARLAESVYTRLGPEEQAETRSLFLRLAGETDDGAIVRRRVSLEELDLDGAPDTDAVVGALTHGRLLTASEGYVEVSHEALLREWPRLRSWIDEDSNGRQLRLHLMSAARAWDEGGREEGDLYRGARLAAVLDWSEQHERELNAAEHAFLDESRAASEREAERQRRTNRRLRALLAGAAVMLVAAMGAGALALAQSRSADEQRQLAEEQAILAGEQAARAEDAEGLARDEAERAESAASIARMRELAAASISFLDEDPALAKLLALSAALVAEPPIEVLSALHQAWAGDRVIGEYRWPDDQEIGQLWIDVDPNGSYVVASETFGNEGPAYMEVRAVATNELLWSKTEPSGAVFNRAFFAGDARHVVVGVTLDDPMVDSEVPRRSLGVFVWDALNGSEVAHFDSGACGGLAFGGTSTHLVVGRVIQDPDSPCTYADDASVAVETLEVATGERSLIAEVALGTEVVVDGDGSVVALRTADGDRSVDVVIDVATGERILELDPAEQPQLDSQVRDLSDDGTLLLYGDRPVMVFDVATGRAVATYGGHAGETFGATFAPDGNSVYSSGRDGTLQHWLARRGTRLGLYPGVSGGRPAPSEAGVTVVAAWTEIGIARVVATDLRGEVGSVETCDSALVAADTLRIVEGRAFLAQECRGEWPRVVIDMVDGLLIKMILPAQDGQGLAVAPDGRRLASQERDDRGRITGPVVRDAEAGDLLVRLEGVCAWEDGPTPPDSQPGCSPYPSPDFPMWNWRMHWSPDGSQIVAINSAHEGISNSVIAWDASSGTLRYTGPVDGAGGGDGAFIDGGSKFVTVSEDHVRVFDTSAWTIDREHPSTGISGSTRILGASRDGSMLYVMDGFGGAGTGSLHWIDIETLETTFTLDRIHEGSPKAASLNPAGTLAATGASDGFVRVWDVLERELVHEFRIGHEQVQGLAFVNNSHLAVAPHSGHLFVYTVDPDELLQLVRGSLIRGFTNFECERFFPDDDCPTLEELRAAS